MDFELNDITTDNVSKLNHEQKVYMLCGLIVQS